MHPSPRFTMDQTEPPSRPLLTPSYREDTNASNGGTKGAFHSFRLSVPKSKEKRKKMKERLGRVNKGLKQFTHACSQLWRGRWTAETCSLLFGLLSLLGLVLTLLAHQNKPLPQWPQLITINSIISLFSLLIRAGVGVVLAEGISQSKWQWFRKAQELKDMERFDLASRSAWGSILLLVSLRIRRPYFIAALGAVITITTALNGFALQQLLQLEECLQPDNNATVEIKRTNYYGAFGKRFGPLIHDIFVPMAVAMDVGILQPVEDLTTVLSSGCITGNCTFPSLLGETFSTLAFSHTCENVTSQVKVVPITQNNTFVDPLTGWNMTGTGSSEYMLSLSMGEDANPLKFALHTGPLVLVTDVTEESYSGPLGTVKMILMPFGSEQYTALSCSLYPSVNTYTAKISNSVLIESLVRSVPIGLNLIPPDHPSHTNQFDVLYKMGTTRTIRDGSQVMCERQEDAAPGYEPVAQANIDAAPKSYPDDHSHVWYLPRDCVWQMRQETIYSMHTYLKQLFGNQGLADAIMITNGTMHLRQLYQEGNMTLETVDEVMNNLTTSMTTVVRNFGWNNSSGIPDAGPARGTMWYTTTCIRIKWPWIAFPAALIGCSAIFLVLVHIESRGTERERLWKSSILAMLFCEMDSEVTSKAQPVRKKVLDGVAKSTSVSLGRENGGLRLVAR